MSGALKRTRHVIARVSQTLSESCNCPVLANTYLGRTAVRSYGCATPRRRSSPGGRRAVTADGGVRPNRGAGRKPREEI